MSGLRAFTTDLSENMTESEKANEVKLPQLIMAAQEWGHILLYMWPTSLKS